MRICLLSASYPPASFEGIARQRYILAVELARRGHDVHVLTTGSTDSQHQHDDVTVHTIGVPAVRHFTDAYVELNSFLNTSFALQYGLEQLERMGAFDIVDVPLWAAQAFVPSQRYTGRLVVWLQTTSAQLFAINRQAITASDRALLALERLSLQRAHGLLADSHVALASVLDDYQPQTTAPGHVVYLGIPPFTRATHYRTQRDTVEALVVGRLERRKGTPQLFELLPSVLRRCPQLRVRFIGSDNSQNDGWFHEHGQTYKTFFQQHFPDLNDQVIFEGRIDEDTLLSRYREADILLTPSIFESFGLIYLEAMRVGLPVITFASGGANEIFAAGEQDGGILVTPGDSAGFAAQLERLTQARKDRLTLGRQALERFQRSFTASTMADATLAFYQQISAISSAQSTPPIYQVMEELVKGDAVSTIALDTSALLGELGYSPQIITKNAPVSVHHVTLPPHTVPDQPDPALIFHYWGYNTSTWMLSATRGPKALYYHNITPPQCFVVGSAMYQAAQRGYAQLQAIADRFQFLIGDSRYNIAAFVRETACSPPSLHIYPVVEPEQIQAWPYDTALVDALRKDGAANLLFVGRIARNKRQHMLMQLFDYYWQTINQRARLWLVGSEGGDREYRAELEHLRIHLRSGSNIIFTGKVSDHQLMAYYRAADVFVCASEHEGFCVPLAQAMAFNLPVVAYAAAAVPETLGGAGLLVNDWDVPRVAELVHLAWSDQDLRAKLVSGQHTSIQRFTRAEARAQLVAVTMFLSQQSPM